MIDFTNQLKWRPESYEKMLETRTISKLGVEERKKLADKIKLMAPFADIVNRDVLKRVLNKLEGGSK